MSKEDKPGFLCHFDELEDPKIDRKKLYPLTDSWKYGDGSVYYFEHATKYQKEI